VISKKAADQKEAALNKARGNSTKKKKPINERDRVAM
jgi:hypothetical protein